MSDDDSFIDLEEEEQNYELDFGEQYVHWIERLDMQTQRGKPKKWEILKLRTDVRIEGQQFGSFQLSQEEIILFGSSFKSEWPHFSDMQIYKFNHDQKQVTKVKEAQSQRQSISYQGQQMQSFHRTNFQRLYDDLDEGYGMF